MKRILYILLALVISAGLLTGCSRGPAADAAAGFVNPDKVRKIVELNSEKDLNALVKELKSAQVIPLKSGSYIVAVDKAEESKLEQKLAAVRGVKRVAAPGRIGIIEPITKVKVGKDLIVAGLEQLNDVPVNDPGAKSQWSLAYTKSSSVWQQISQKKTVNVAVVDTGVDYNHPDLKNRVRKDLGYDFVNNDHDPMDDNGHGTHVSGIIAAEANNNEGIVGITGTLEVNIIPVKVLDRNGMGQTDAIARGIEYAADQGADIINLSLGGEGEDQDIAGAVKYALNKGAFVVAAAGNDSRNCDQYTPAGLADVYTIAASNLLNRKAVFSNYGDSVDIAAPGVKILSTVPGGEYEAWDGTSMAAAVVSGIAAMLKAQDPALDIQKLALILNQSAKDVMEAGKDQKTGYGIIDAANAYALSTGAAPVQETASGITNSRMITNEQGRLLERLGQITGSIKGININELDAAKTFTSSNNAAAPERQNLQTKEFAGKLKGLQDENQEEIEAFKEQFKLNFDTNSSYVKEILANADDLLRLLNEFEAAYSEGTFQLTPDEAAALNDEVEKLQSYVDQAKQLIGELEQQWNELVASWKAGETKEVTAGFEKILAVQKQLTGILETVIDEMNYLIELLENIIN